MDVVRHTSLPTLGRVDINFSNRRFITELPESLACSLLKACTRSLEIVFTRRTMIFSSKPRDSPFAITSKTCRSSI